MQFINKLKKNQKGFTLVELIVVLVILAILAAFTIPAMLGFVNDARDKASIAEARECYVAAQAVSTEVGSTVIGTAVTSANVGTGIVAYGTTKETAAPTGTVDATYVKKLSNYKYGKLITNDVKGQVTKVTYAKDADTSPFNVASIEYK
ncbi:MAG: prepilin-type N-terminal cleavage/methylation domain-containing protein, partial [Eubacterium sp.]